MNLDQITFVLVAPSHPGNIGAVARAMKTMGLQRLALVQPRRFPDDEATARAAGASDVLENALIVDDLDAAIADCELVIGTSVRDRRVSWPIKSPQVMGNELKQHLQANPVAKIAIVFGRERTGLENHELDKTHWQIRIPANAEYSSLNLAAAAQIIAYELRCALTHSLEGTIDTAVSTMSDSASEAHSTHIDNIKTGVQQRQRNATQAELSGYYTHLESTLAELGFIKQNASTKLMRKIIRLYNRAQVNVEELQILRGILTATQNVLKKTK